MAAALWASAAPVSSDQRELVYVIPRGTWARKVAGEKLNVIPSTVRLTLGVQDILVLRNEDEAPALFGPVLLMPRQSYRIPARVPSRFELTCPLHESGRLTILVEKAPEAGWPRLRWRVARLFEDHAAPSSGEATENEDERI
ncbi:MAG: hypothetical protein A3F90_02730 [Deltaproteobacteria bacterium RIFCSPLOWO2_12_FULL_60_19]|nr:MAG: hypothetical protein A3F90_02730 [Deltaproteobacteria bacterium RIFCSPLOWO2_12_FULL_60_19]